MTAGETSEGTTAPSRSSAVKGEGRGRVWKDLPQNLALLVAAIAVVLVLVEGVLRAAPQLLPEEVELRMHWERIRTAGTVTEPDPYLGFRYPATYEGRIDRGDLSFGYATDEHGFRNPPGWPDTAGIVIVGDSQAFGYGVEDAEAWPRLLEERLQGARVINLGLIGAAPQQYTRALERYGLGLSPDLVIYTLFPGNDLVDAELFADWETAGSPGNYDVWRFFRGRSPDAGGLLARAVGEFRVVALLRHAGGVAAAEFRSRTIETADGRRLRLAPNAYASSAARAHPGHPAFQRVLDAVLRARALAEDEGAGFLVLLVPTKSEVYLPLLDERSPALVEPFSRALEERGVETLDLTPAFRSAADGPALYFEVDGHPNAAGNELISNVVYGRVAARTRPAGPRDPPSHGP